VAYKSRLLLKSKAASQELGLGEQVVVVQAQELLLQLLAPFLSTASEYQERTFCLLLVQVELIPYALWLQCQKSDQQST
jgi:hypothetical protein